MPELLSYQALPDTLFVAYADAEQTVMMGAAAAVPKIRDMHFPGFPVMVRVQEAFRRQGVGRALIQAVSGYVASWDVPYMHGWQAYRDGTEQAFLSACGFKPYLNVYTFEAWRDQALHLIDILNKYSARDAQKAAYCFEPLNPAQMQAEVQLYSEHFQVPFDVAQQKLLAYMGLPNALTLSASVYVAGALQGFLIGFEDADGVPKVEFWVTQQQLSHTPAAMLLLCHFARLFYERGYPKGRFECNDHARTTLNLLKRLKVEEVSRSQSWALETVLP